MTFYLYQLCSKLTNQIIKKNKKIGICGGYMNVKRLLAIAVLVTTLVPNTEALHAMRAPAKNARRAPAAQSCPKVRGAVNGAVKILGVAAVGALIMYIILNRPTDINLPDACTHVMSQGGVLLTNVTESIQPCLNALYSLAQNTHRSLDNCNNYIAALRQANRENVIAEQLQCNLAAERITSLTKQVTRLLSERSDLVCANVTGFVSNITGMVSSWVPGWLW